MMPVSMLVHFDNEPAALMVKIGTAHHGLVLIQHAAISIGVAVNLLSVGVEGNGRDEVEMFALLNTLE